MDNESRQKQRRKFLLFLSTPISSPKEHYLLRNHSSAKAASLQHTRSPERGLLFFSSSALAITYVAPVTSGINNMMIIQTKGISSSVNEFYIISDMFGKFLCTILGRILKIHKAGLSYLPMAGRLELDDHQGPFQPLPFYDSMILFLPMNMRNTKFNNIKISR